MSKQDPSLFNTVACSIVLIYGTSSGHRFAGIPKLGALLFFFLSRFCSRNAAFVLSSDSMLIPEAKLFSVVALGGILCVCMRGYLEIITETILISGCQLHTNPALTE